MNYANIQVLRTIAPRSPCGPVDPGVRRNFGGVGPAVALGEICRVWERTGHRFFWAETVGFRDDTILFAPLTEVDGLGPGVLFG
jgi:flagellum-specific ATP synthase